MHTPCPLHISCSPGCLQVVYVHLKLVNLSPFALLLLATHIINCYNSPYLSSMNNLFLTSLENTGILHNHILLDQNTTLLVIVHSQSYHIRNTFRYISLQLKIVSSWIHCNSIRRNIKIEIYTFRITWFVSGALSQTHSLHMHSPLKSHMKKCRIIKTFIPTVKNTPHDNKPTFWNTIQ